MVHLFLETEEYIFYENPVEEFRKILEGTDLFEKQIINIFNFYAKCKETSYFLSGMLKIELKSKVNFKNNLNMNDEMKKMMKNEEDEEIYAKVANAYVNLFHTSYRLMQRCEPYSILNEEMTKSTKDYWRILLFSKV